jgi:kumamolisin
MAGGPATGAPAPAEQSVTFLLSPPDPAHVAALAREHHLGRGQRTAKLAALLPGSARQRTVAAALRLRGLRVTRSTPWSITARGPAARVGALTGGPSASAPWRQLSGLQGLVSAATGPDRGRPVAHPVSATAAPRFTPSLIDGPSARTLYSAPLVPASRGTALTIATLQLSGWDATDLTRYASNHGIADPVGAGRYQAVSVDGADPALPDGGQGDLEVALDQEALLAVAPAAHQRAYFAPNTDVGFVDALEQVATDALDPGNHLSALSISWGACEQDWDPQTIAAVDTAVSHVVAAGV